MTRTTKTIKAELAAELDKGVPDEGRVSELMAELERARGTRPSRGGRPRLRREEVSGSPETSPDGDGRIDPGQDPDQAAIATWPPELRAKISGSAYGRIIGW